MLTYEIVYFRNENGFSPVEKFMDELPDKDRVKVFAHIRLLKEKGFLPFPYTSGIIGASKLRELRIRISLRRYRIIYFMFTGKKIVLLHGFMKKTKEIPKREIETSLRRKEDFLKKEAF